MADTLLGRILFTCRHEFSWPRRSSDGSYYQVCLQCGTRYRYDWTTMRRLSRLDHDPDLETAATSKKPVRKCGGRSGWHPRDRRLRVDVRVLYRLKGDNDWLQGNTVNISRSGLLFSASQLLPLGAEVELIFEMPREICGASGKNVLCRATIARSEDSPPQLAAIIADYEILPEAQAASM